jgi:homoserine kinase type II
MSGWLGRVPAMLAPWHDRPVPLQWCVGDVWHDNLLFTGNQLTGLIDYGAVKVDHVAADLGRMLGSLVGDDEGLFARGLWAYAAEAPLDAGAGELARVLDQTGVVLAAANWLRRLYGDREAFPDRAAVARRLAALVGRMEGWK